MLLKAIGFILLIAFFQHVVNLILFFDVNKKVYNHHPGECKAVPGIDNGSEDLDFIDDRGLVFISSGVIYLPENEVLFDGHIFLYDFNQPGKASRVEIDGLDEEVKANFHPHGLSHWILKDGTIRLFVINHSKKFHHSILLLDFDETTKRLRLVKTVKDDKFIRPNDLAAIGEDEFVLSNDGTTQSALANLIETLTFSYSDSLVYYDGEKTKYLLMNDKAANGVSFSKDHKKLFVSHYNHKLIGVYDWDNVAKKVDLSVEIPLLTLPDNFHVEKDNVLWIGAHPVLKDAVDHLSDTQNRDFFAPSQILRIQFSKDWKKWEITEVLADDGRLVCASSVAVRSGDELLIGTVQRELIHCKIDIPLSVHDV